MAIPRKAVVRGVRSLSAAARAIELEVIDAEPPVWRGGQYIIVDGGFMLPNGKACKRAYSPVNDDRDPARLELWVMRIADGPGSGFLHGVEPGREIAFSGPWGKLYPGAVVSDAAPGEGARTLILATDTGITAALGLVRGARMAPWLARSVLIWLRAQEDYFVPEAEVRARLPPGIGEVHLGLAPPIGHPERLACARAVVAAHGGAAAFTQGFISGDGLVNYGLLDDLCAAGVAATRENVESFFNMPKRPAPVAAPPAAAVEAG
jgi:ferredoxin-NADP reductase